MEIFDIVDEQGSPIGETVARETAHAQGIRHRTSHVWLVRSRGGKYDVLLQKRSDHKDSFPGCYDISSAGHIPAGVDWLPSALRELSEELGITMDADQLRLAGVRSVFWQGEFYGKPFLDREVSRIYYALWDGDETALHLQESEVASVCWMDLENAIRETRDGTLANCIYPEELEMVKKALESGKNP